MFFYATVSIRVGLAWLVGAVAAGDPGSNQAQAGSVEAVEGGFPVLAFEAVNELVGLPTTTNGIWGASWYDTDGDGFLELALGGHHTPPLLFSYSAAQAFTDVTHRFGNLPTDGIQDRHNLLFGDFTHDGVADAYIIHGGEMLTGDKRNELLVYDQVGDVYDDVAGDLGVLDPFGKGRVVLLFDHDGDGVTDLYLVNTRAGSMPGASMNRAFQGDLLGQFTPDAGSGLELENQVSGGCYPFDYDNDHDPDILLINQSNLILLQNDGGTFSDVAADVGLTETVDQFSGAVADFDNDGWMDVIVAYKVDRTRQELALYRNQGGTFATVANTGLDASGIFGEMVWADLDNDGYQDLYIGVEELEGETTRNLLYRNLGDGTFEEMAVAAGVQAMPGGVPDKFAAVADYDGDGRVDIITGAGHGNSSNPNPFFLYRNITENSNSFLGIKLRGPAGNVDAIGARVTVRAGSSRQYRQHYIGVGSHSQSSPILHFGLGLNNTVRVRVEWPNGRRRRYNDLSINSVHTLTQPSGP